MKIPTGVLRAATAFAVASSFLVAPVVGGGLPSAHNGSAGPQGRQEIELLREQYRLRMTFVDASTGAYLRGVTVVISQGDGASELRFHDCGPQFFVAAERGVYRVSATYAGVTQSRSVDLRKRAQDLVFRWPAV